MAFGFVAHIDRHEIFAYDVAPTKGLSWVRRRRPKWPERGVSKIGGGGPPVAQFPYCPSYLPPPGHETPSSFPIPGGGSSNFLSHPREQFL